MIAMKTPALDTDRMLSDLDQLNEFGRLENGGVERIAFGKADREARQWLRSELEKLPVEIRTDTAGNTLARLPGRDPELAPIVVGSHTDTVPNGGRFDGALGVIAALACLRALAERESPARHPVEWVNFAAEEATTTAGTFGSRAMAGLLSEPEIRDAGFEPGRIADSQHSPDEFTEPGQCVVGAKVLLGALRRVDSLGGDHEDPSRGR